MTGVNVGINDTGIGEKAPIPEKPYEIMSRKYADIIKKYQETGGIRTGFDYENYIVDILRLHGFIAERSGGDDFGVDIRASITIKNKERRFYIQCKHHNNTIGKGPIQEVFTGVHYYRNDALPVVIASGDITYEARQYAYRLGVEVIGYPEWSLYEKVAATGEAPKHHKNGLFGILLGKLVGNEKYTALAVKRQKTTPPDTKEEMKKIIENKFAEAEECTREAARLQQYSADYAQRALQLQKEAILQNLDFI